MSSKTIEELDLAGPTVSLTEEDEQKLLEFDGQDTTPNAQSVRIGICFYLETTYLVLSSIHLVYSSTSTMQRLEISTLLNAKSDESNLCHL